MLYREIIAVCSQIHTKHINTLCGQNVEFFCEIEKFRNANISFVVSVCPSVVVEQLCTNLKDFYKI
jgi:hypothetical protein